jgi:uncharacterized protein (UPF0335 family)
MEIYQMITMTFYVMSGLGLVGGVVAYLIRKNDKVAAAVPRIAALEESDTEVKRQIEAIWRKTDSWGVDIDELRKDMNRESHSRRLSNDLIFRALSGLASKVGAMEVAEMIDRETIRDIPGKVS